MGATPPVYWRLELDESENRLQIRERTRDSPLVLCFYVYQDGPWRVRDLIRALETALERRELEGGGRFGPVSYISVHTRPLFSRSLFVQWCRRRELVIAYRDIDYFFFFPPSSVSVIAIPPPAASDGSGPHHPEVDG